MAQTRFRKLLTIIEALAPLCNFESPEGLLTSQERYNRALYEHFTQEFKNHINLKT